MIISPIKIARIKYNKPINKVYKTKGEKPEKEFSFGSISPQLQNVRLLEKREEEYFNEFLTHKGKVTKEEYEDIVKNHPSTLIEANKYCNNNYGGIATPEDMAVVVLKINEFLKKNYRNFRIISIGTSPAPITEQLEQLGCDTVYLPLSSFRKYNPNKDSIYNNPQLKILLDYLKSKNIDDGKLNLILDYTVSGKTLDNVIDFIDKNYDEFEESLKFRAANLNIIMDAVFRNSSYDEEECKKNVECDIKCSEVEHISNVPHFPVFGRNKKEYPKRTFTVRIDNKTQDTIFKEFENSSQPLARAFSLCTMHEINKLKGEQ